MGGAQGDYAAAGMIQQGAGYLTQGVRHARAACGTATSSTSQADPTDGSTASTGSGGSTSGNPPTAQAITDALLQNPAFTGIDRSCINITHIHASTVDPASAATSIDTATTCTQPVPLLVHRNAQGTWRLISFDIGVACTGKAPYSVLMDLFGKVETSSYACG